jgi:teichuronic acid biosynthesis glycosyltransferase TuaG
MPKISIVMPAYNAEAYIQETLESIASQTYADFECIVVNDGSKDKTLDLVLEFQKKDNRFKSISIENSGGPAKPRNLGIAAAGGEYISLFDSDDLMHPEKLALSVSALDRHPKADILFTNFASIDEQGRLLKNNYLADYELLWRMLDESPNLGQVTAIAAEKFYEGVCTVNFVGTSSVVLRRSGLSEGNAFNESLKNSDDRLFWMQFSKNHNAIFIDVVLHQYRVQKGGISNQGFLRRGPSKIKALEIALLECENPAVENSLKQQIAKDYLGLAYACWLHKKYTEQSHYALKSLSIRASFIGVKLLLESLVFGFFKR